MEESTYLVLSLQDIEAPRLHSLVVFTWHRVQGVFHVLRMEGRMDFASLDAAPPNLETSAYRDDTAGFFQERNGWALQCRKS